MNAKSNDAELLAAIREAVKDGCHAEVRQKADGIFAVYKVKKKIVASGK